MLKTIAAILATITLMSCAPPDHPIPIDGPEINHTITIDPSPTPSFNPDALVGSYHYDHDECPLTGALAYPKPKTHQMTIAKKLDGYEADFLDVLLPCGMKPILQTQYKLKVSSTKLSLSLEGTLQYTACDAYTMQQEPEEVWNDYGYLLKDDVLYIDSGTVCGRSTWGNVDWQQVYLRNENS